MITNDIQMYKLNLIPFQLYNLLPTFDSKTTTKKSVDKKLIEEYAVKQLNGINRFIEITLIK